MTNKKIFIVDDDESLLLLLDNAFSKLGFTVMTRSSPVGATFEIRKFRPDVLILDVMMPDFSGDVLADLIAQNVRPAPKIIFYSSKSKIELEKIAREKCAHDYVCKTDGPQTLVKSVMALLNH